ncbi:MAG: prepilin-type N-terminal cleavage/methylation domain-containing protein [Oscillibacter sp.]|nr:prepilin-type N-terminal cleavage/methylation domain-containing protein [Oscillibacter sp.]
MKKQNQKGFTLAELLIVVAIIAVLVAIAIPVFTKRLEASRETTDIANLRSAYATATVAVMSGKKDITATTMYFNPNTSTGLSKSEADATKIGKGTVYPGGADTATLPSIITYTSTTAAAGKSIVISFDGTSQSAGKVNSIKFTT